jgi:hypothetical protein
MAGGFDKRLHKGWQVDIFHQPPAQLVGNVQGDVARLALGCAEGDDAHRTAILAVHQVADQRLGP